MIPMMLRFHLSLQTLLCISLVSLNITRASSKNPPLLSQSSTKGEVSTNQLKVRVCGYLQVDSRFLSGNGYPSEFVLRRIRPILKAQIQPDLTFKCMLKEN